MNGIVIDLDVKVAKSSTALKRFEQVADKLDNTLAQITSQVSKQISLVNTLAGSYNKVSVTANRAASASRRIKAPPRIGFSDPQAIISQYAPGVMAGDPFAARMVNKAQSQINAQKRAMRTVNPPDPLMTALMRTRFTNSVFGRIGHPLGVDLAQFAGNPAAIGMMNGAGGQKLASLASAAARVAPLLIGLGAAAAAAASLIKMSYANISDQRTANVRLGGSVGQSRSAQMAADAFGINIPGVMGNIGSGGVASSIAMKYGVSPVRGYFGDINDSAAFAKLVRGIGGLSYDRARREAIGLGSPELANFALLSGSTRERLISSRSNANDMSNLKANAELQANFQIIASESMRIVNSGIGPIFRVMGKILPIVADNFEKFAKGAEIVAYSTGMGYILDMLDKLSGVDKKKTDNQKFSDAVDKFQRTVDGQSGGGPRTNGAVPDGYRNRPMDESVRAHNQRQFRPGLL